MDMNQYQLEAQNTKSDKFYGEKIPLATLLHSFKRAIEAIEQLDSIKKTLFYGKPFLTLQHGKTVYEAPSIGAVHAYPQAAHDLIHGIIGKVTESGELLEALFNTLSTGEELDETNILEEVGDGFWYDAMILQVLHTDFEHVAYINNKKLRARFPDKFTEESALNRNLATERAILEGKS